MTETFVPAANCAEHRCSWLPRHGSTGADEVFEGRPTFARHPPVYLMPESIFAGPDAALLDDYSTSNVSWANAEHGGCPGTATFATTHDASGFPEAAIGGWPVSNFHFGTWRHRMHVAVSDFRPIFTSMPGRGAALVMMFRVVKQPDGASDVSDLLTVDGSGGDPDLHELWMLRYHPQNSSIECLMNGTVSVSSSLGKVRMDEWYIVECRLNALDILTLRVNGDSSQQQMLPVYAAPVPSRTFLLEDREVEVGHVRARVDVQIAAVVVHDEAVSDLEADMIEEHMMDQLAEVYPDVPDACPGGPPPADGPIQSSCMRYSLMMLYGAVAHALANLIPSPLSCFLSISLSRHACWSRLLALVNAMASHECAGCGMQNGMRVRVCGNCMPLVCRRWYVIQRAR